MTTPSVHQPAARRSSLARLGTYFYLRPRLALALLLGPPLGWLGVVYLGSLAALVAQSFFHLDAFSGRVVRQLTLATYGDLLSQVENYRIAIRTVGMASAVTLAAVALAFPLSYYMARHASGRIRALLYVAVLLPLWSNYLVRVFAWKIILAKEGILGWIVNFLHLGWGLEAVLRIPVIGGPSLSNSMIGMFLVFLYVWLPYMILPVEAALERLPRTLLEASGDLGARPSQTFRHVILPLVFPGIVAGSIFTFSLTLGDYIIPSVVGAPGYFIGMMVYQQQGTAGNLPLAAAFSVVPIILIAVYLALARRMGAFDAL